MQSRVHIERVRIIPYDVRATVTRDTGGQGEERTLWVRQDYMTKEVTGQLAADLEKCTWDDVPGLMRRYTQD
jgi:hypothetical protein